MNSETVLFVLVLAGALLPLAFRPRRIWPWAWGLGLCTVAFAVLGESAWRFRTDRTAYSDARLKAVVPHLGRPDDGFASSDVCRSCHPGEYASWHATYHRTMTQVVGPDALIVGDFDDVRLKLDGLVFHLQRRGDEYWVKVNNGIRKRVVAATGSHHYQVYWISAGQGRKLETFPFVYLIEEQRWVMREDTFLRPPEAGRFTQFWNNSCIKCHTTYGQRRMNPQTGVMDSRVAEMGISCESCHGPGEAHVRANRDPVRRYGYHLGVGSDTTMVHPRRLPAPVSSQICGQCHSIFSAHDPEEWNHIGYTYRPGDDLEATRAITRPAKKPRDPWLAFFLKQHPDHLEKQFWPDGQVRVSGREYNGLIESPCYKGGEFSCLSCHSMHRSDPDDQLAAGMEGDEACFQCHETYRARVENHTRHRLDSSGSRCTNCHMPHTTFGLLKAIRSHTVDSPTVANSVETGRPNACNLCHLDQTLSWTANTLSEWYGLPEVDLNKQERSVAAAPLWLLQGDAAQRAIVAWHMGWEPAKQASGRGWLAPFLTHLLTDPYAAVRFVAYRSLRRLPDYGDFAYDFVGPSGERAQAGQQALARWRRAGVEGLDRVGAKVLIDSSGVLLQERMDDLAQQRDDRWVELLE